MIGLEGPKAIMATQILSLCNQLANPDATNPCINTVIYGPPGCGKTTLANVLSQLYLRFGASNGKLIKGDRSNLIGDVVGATAIKTRELLTESLGGVLFIDEAYQLGHAADGNKCPFAYECINAINLFITEHPGKLIIILAGYKPDIMENFFAQNQGLVRRFPWEYTLTTATPDELYDIFLQQTNKAGYSLAKDAISPSFFRQNELMFEYSGGDTQTFFDKCKMIHDKRMFSVLKLDKTINDIDILKGFNIYKSLRSSENHLFYIS
jgi:stage V sporulation protein K